MNRKLPRCCPRCGRGRVLPAKIRRLGAPLHVCEACEAAWWSTAAISGNAFSEFAAVMAAAGLEPSWAELDVDGEAGDLRASA